MKIILRVAALPILCMVFAVSNMAVGQTVQGASDPVALAIAAELDALANPDMNTIHGARIALPERVQEFYSRRAFQAAWTDPQIAEQLLRALADSYADGLDPADYYLPLLRELTAQVAAPTATAVQRARYDVLLTEALLRLGYHLSFGKVDPESFDPQWNYGRTLASIDVTKEIEDAIAAADVYQRVEALKPTHPLYVNLKRELARYREAMHADWPSIAAGAALKAGHSDARVLELRTRLIATGDLEATNDNDSPLYDEYVEAAVRRFQQRTGLEADGAAGAGTVRELNVSPAQRIGQLRVNLDRGRVLLQDLPQEFIVVNIAGFNVYFVRGDQVIWNARAQVGKPYRRTPIFRSEISYLVLNPTWTVPPGIIQSDILPQASRDPQVITRKGLKVFDAAGSEVDPASIDWSRFRSGHIPYTLRQDPGPNNALGRVKLMFPNDYFVYLHDTPSQVLFDRAERTFSSGCVRVERALELAELVLDDPEHWNSTSIANAISSERLQNITLKKQIPVLLTYWTAWVEPQGVTNFRQDVYGQDAKWATALDAEFKVRAKPLFSLERSP
jgi:L,D-transpeptidase YcbB